MAGGPDKETLDEQKTKGDGAFAVPGVVVVFSGGYPLFRFGPLRDGNRKFGRGDDLGLDHDAKLSRDHAEVSFDGGEWKVSDLDSKNGTFVDGTRVQGRPFTGRPRVIRLGQTLLLPVEDGTDALTHPLIQESGRVTGEKLRRTLREVRRAAELGLPVLLTGETGSGKETAAQTFHAASTHRNGPLVSVDCTSMPDGQADGLLFGVKRGAPGDIEGYIQSAEGGVLFLDGIGAIDREIQAKLAKVLETRELLPLGAPAARRVNVRFCFATHRNPREAAESGDFSPELFDRLAKAEVRVPPLRERLDEIPWIASREAERVASGLRVSADFLEACMLRTWPGNVTEFTTEVQRAAKALAATTARTLLPEHLLPTAGQLMSAHGYS